MSFYFHPDAETELSHAVAYYEELQKDLGLAFAQEIFDTIQRIIEFPEAWQPITTKSRRCLTNRFSLRCYLPDPGRCYCHYSCDAPSQRTELLEK